MTNRKGCSPLEAVALALAVPGPVRIADERRQCNEQTDASAVSTIRCNARCFQRRGDSMGVTALCFDLTGRILLTDTGGNRDGSEFEYYSCDSYY